MRTMSSRRVVCAFLFLAAGVIVSSSSCGTPLSHCLASNCAGCCSADGVCLKGDIVKACGRGGLACQDCGSSGTCAEQVCIVLVPDGGDGGGEATGGGAQAGGSGGGG